ncbi:MAG: glycosyltransferase [Phycisphaeraceae bacterium]
MTFPRITIVITNLNDARYLERAICSVIDQDYPQLELLVVDGGSKDTSPSIIRRYGRQIAWSTSLPDAGPASAINLALTHASGDIVGLLPSDDLYLPGALHAVGERMTAADRPRWLAGSVMRYGAADQELAQLTASLPTDLPTFLLGDVEFLPRPGVFYRRSVLESRGGLDAGLEYRFLHELNCRLLMSGLVPALLRTPVAAQRCRPRHQDFEALCQRGLEQARIAQHYSEALPLRYRYWLWQQCQQRRHMLERAAREAADSPARRTMWQRLLSQKSTLTSELARATLTPAPAGASVGESAA